MTSPSFAQSIKQDTKETYEKKLAAQDPGIEKHL